MQIWRINLKSDGVEPDQFCINNNFLGVGWAVDGGYAGMGQDEYYELGMNQYYNQNYRGWWPAINAIIYKMEVNDLCWTRDRNGIYYLGQISEEWEYRDGEEYRQADIYNLRLCNWNSVGGVDAVPGKVLNSFPRRTVQAVDDHTVAIYSQYLYAELTNANEFELPDDGNVDLDLFSLVSNDDCEDFIGIYLQVEYDYVLLPSTCKKDMMKTEFVLKNLEGEKAYVQVKQGEGINKDDYLQHPGDPAKWFLFSTTGEYYGGDYEHIVCLEPECIREFVLEYEMLMSGRVQNWLGLLANLGFQN